MPHARQSLGNRGEALAELYLTQRGYQVLVRNYRCPYGEIDMICRDGSYLVFVEVKTRRGSAFGAPEEAVTASKLAHIVNAAGHYLVSLNTPEEQWRIDVVAICLDAGGRLLDTRLIAGVGG